jgi:hypothetical protein
LRGYTEPKLPPDHRSWLCRIGKFLTVTLLPPSPKRKLKACPVKNVTLALQGGGAHGAFVWGVVDRLLEDGRLGIEAISATSAA